MTFRPYYDSALWRSAALAAGYSLKPDGFSTLAFDAAGFLNGVWSPAGENGGWLISP